MDGPRRGEVALAGEVGPFAVGEPAHDLGDHEVGVGVALAVAVRAHVDGHAIDGDGQIGAVVEIEAAQEVLVGFALAAVLRHDQPRHGFEHLAGAVGGARLQVRARHEALTGRLGLADLACRGVDRLHGRRTGARRLGRGRGSSQCRSRGLLLELPRRRGLLLGRRRRHRDGRELRLDLLGTGRIDADRNAGEARGGKPETHDIPQSAAETRSPVAHAAWRSV